MLDYLKFIFRPLSSIIIFIFFVLFKGFSFAFIPGPNTLIVYSLLLGLTLKSVYSPYNSNVLYQRLSLVILLLSTITCNFAFTLNFWGFTIYCSLLGLLLILTYINRNDTFSIITLSALPIVLLMSSIPYSYYNYTLLVLFPALFFLAINYRRWLHTIAVLICMLIALWGWIGHQTYVVNPIDGIPYQQYAPNNKHRIDLIIESGVFEHGHTYVKLYGIYFNKTIEHSEKYLYDIKAVHRPEILQWVDDNTVFVHYSQINIHQ